ncbi:hypothetical protein from bacteriophage origin [Escherichia coli IAI1]|nr:hypothetical protein from bacteriophage origin [Escherichia coli IAI1]
MSRCCPLRLPYAYGLGAYLDPIGCYFVLPGVLRLTCHAVQFVKEPVLKNALIMRYRIYMRYGILCQYENELFCK